MAKPVINYKKCKTCGTCVEVCPVQVFEKGKDRVVVKYPDECINCKSCEANCPQGAIKVEE